MALEGNKFGSCTDGGRGTGLGDCIKQFGDPTGVEYIGKGWSSTDILTETIYKGLIQAETFKPLNNIYNFAQNTPENERATGNTGLLSLIRAGKPFFTYTFDAGYELHKSIYSLRGKDRADFAFKFDTGLFFGTNTAGTSIKGFDGGLFDVETFKFISGTDPEMTDAVFQLKNALEFNTRGRFYTWEELGFDGNLQNGVINAVLSYNTAPTSAPTIEVKVVDSGNESVNIMGLTDPSNWNLGGTQASPTAIDSVAYNSGGYYVLTLDLALASGDTIQPSLAGVVETVAVPVAVNASGDFYKGSADSATI